MKQTSFHYFWFGLALLALSVLPLCSAAHAEEYIVDPNAASPLPANTYKSLEDLRTASIAWQDGDTIKITGDDASLTAPFDFGMVSVTLRGYGVVTPNNPTATNAQFAKSGDNTSTNSLTLVADAGKTLKISDFDSTTSGGALYADADLSLRSGSFRFADNHAEESGGAVYVSGNGTFVAKDGDLLFRGNTANNNTAGVANAIHADNASNNKTLILAATAGRSVLLYDPVTSSNTNPNLTIDINYIDTDDNDTPDTVTDGKVVFDGAHWLAQGKTPAADAGFFTSAVYGNTTVHGGTLELRNGVTYGGSNTVGSFTLNGGATLAADAGGNVVRANTITSASGSILAFDLTGATGSTVNLTLDAANSLTGNPAAVDILAFGGAGTFKLVTRSIGTFGATLPVLIVRGEDVSSTRASSVLGGGGTNTLMVSGEANGVVTWTGAAGSYVWSATSANWDTTTDNLGNSGKFLHGDAVVFSGVGNAITIQDRGVQVAAQGANPGVEIASGVWTFQGGDLEGGDILISGDATVTFDGVTLFNGPGDSDDIATGTRRMNQRVTVGNGVTASLQSTADAMFVFADMSAGDTYGGAISGGDSSSLTLGGNFKFIDNSANGSVANSGYGGAIYAGGTLNFTDGSYIFTGNSATGSGSSSGYGGAIDAGNLNIQSGDYRFINNSAEQQGGAIWVYENATLIADGGDILFQGNTAAGNPNAMYLNNFNNNKTLTLAAKTGQRIDFYDPIESSSARPGLTISINSTDGTATGKTDGTVLFDTHQSNVYGNTSVYGGGMKLTNGAIYGADGNTGTFTLNEDATLSGTGGVVAASHSVSGTLSPGDTAGAIGTLTFTGDATFNSDSIFQIDMTDPTTYDQIAVNGNAVLNGATLQISGVGMSDGTTINILTAGSSISGTFGNIVFNDPSLTVLVTYDANAVRLTFRARAAGAVSIPVLPLPLLIILALLMIGLVGARMRLHGRV